MSLSVAETFMESVVPREVMSLTKGNQNHKPEELYPLFLGLFLFLSIMLPSLCDYLFHLIVDWLLWKPEVVCLLRVSLETIKAREGRREREKAERHGLERVTPCSEVLRIHLAPAATHFQPPSSLQLCHTDTFSTTKSFG